MIPAEYAADPDFRLRVVQAYRKAFNKGHAEGIVAFKHTENGVWDLTADVPSASTGELYRVTGLGRADWADLDCTCPAGNHIACKHRAMAAWAFEYATWGQRSLVSLCDACEETFCRGNCPAADDLGLAPMHAPKPKATAARARADHDFRVMQIESGTPTSEQEVRNANDEAAAKMRQAGETTERLREERKNPVGLEDLFS